jgi:cell division septum initiation protein DivIVA
MENNKDKQENNVNEWAEELAQDGVALANNDSILEEMDNASHKDDAAVEEVSELNVEDVSSEMFKVEKNPVFKTPSFGSSFRGYSKDEVDSFINNVLSVYNKISKTQNYDMGVIEAAGRKLEAQSRKIANLESKIVKQDSKSEAALIAKIEKKSKQITEKANADAANIIKKAKNEASIILTKMKADSDKQKAGYSKLETAAKAKAASAIVKAEAQAKALLVKAAKQAEALLAKSAKEAEAVVAKGAKEIKEAQRVLRQQKDINERLIAFYSTQIKSLKEENKKFNK